MLETERQSADEVRSSIERGLRDPGVFRAALMRVRASERDAWLDRALGLGALPEDGPDLPPGCVPYLPSPVDVLLRMVDQTPIRSSDTFVDVGAGTGRAAAFVHLLTGASVVGLEVQRSLAGVARELAARLAIPHMAAVEGDAAQLAGQMVIGTVFFLYCPFSGHRLEKVLADLEPIARTRTIHVCAVDLPLPACSWLTLQSALSGDLAIYRSNLLDPGDRRDPASTREAVC